MDKPPSPAAPTSKATKAANVGCGCLFWCLVAIAAYFLFWPKSDDKTVRTGTPEEIIKAAATDGLRDGVRAIKVEAIKSGEFKGKFTVDVSFNVGRVYSEDFAKKETRRRMVAAYQNLWETGLPISIISFSAYSSMIDPYGNASEQSVFETWMDFRTADKVNWKNAMILNFDDIWKVSFIHPSMKLE